MIRLAIGLFVLLPTLVLAQCPTIQQRYQRLEAISGLSTPDSVRLELTKLVQQSRDCHTLTDSVYAKMLHVLGRSYWHLGKLDTAITIIKQAITVNSLNEPDTRRANLVHSYYNLGRVFEDKADYSQAIQTFQTAIAIAKQYPEKWASGASAYTELSYIYYNLGDYEKAVKEAEAGYFLAHQAHDSFMVSSSLIQLAQASSVLGNLSMANESLLKALLFAQQTGDLRLTANVNSLLADVANRQGFVDQSLTYYQKAYDWHRRTNFRHGCFQTLTSMGLVYAQKKNDYDKALSIYKQALTYCDDIGNRIALLNSMGSALRGKKQYKEALSTYQKAIHLIDPSTEKAVFFVNPSKRANEVFGYKEYALSLLRDKADTWLDYAKQTNNRQRFQNALATYQVADQMVDFMRWEHTGQLSKLFWREKTRGMYERAIETCYRLNNVDQALRYFEKSRAAMLADKLNELGAQQHLSPQQTAEEQKLQKLVSEQQTKLASIKPDDQAKYKTALLDFEQAQQALQTFRKRLEASNPAYYGYKYDTTATSLVELKQHLKRQQASFVTYFVGDSALYVLGVTADTCHLLRRPLRTYEQDVQTFMGMLLNADALNRKTNRDQFLVAGNSLYSQLLAPLNLPKGRVIVSPDGSFVPFETLSQKPNSTDYLVNKYAFSYVYSAQLLLKTNVARADKRSITHFLGVAPVTFATSLKQVTLRGSDDALIRIAGHFHSPELLTHQAATRQAFLAKAYQASIIQLFTHATADSAGQEPTLYFADSTLKLSDLNNKAMPNAEMVMLTACKTGVGAIQKGEGVFSLARGFAALGVPSVLTTLWSVQDDATYSLTELFYKYLDEGLSKDIALQRAKLDWLKVANLHNQSPTLWAGLIIVGDTQPIHQSYFWLIGASSVVLILGGVGIWFLQQRKRRNARLVASLPHLT